LEEHLSPYLLSQFANDFKIDENPWTDFGGEDTDLVFGG
jgi:hypothetical protein